MEPYLYAVGVSVPFGSFTVTPTINGARSIVHYIPFATFFYLGFIRKSGPQDRAGAGMSPTVCAQIAVSTRRGGRKTKRHSTAVS